MCQASSEPVITEPQAPDINGPVLLLTVKLSLF